MGIGVSCYEWCLAESGDVPETLFVDVRNVHHNPELVAGSNQRLTTIGEAGSGIGRVGKQVRHAFTEVIRSTPYWTERPQTSRVEDLQRVEVRIDRFRPLEVNDGGHYSGERLVQLR